MKKRYLFLLLTPFLSCQEATQPENSTTAPLFERIVGTQSGITFSNEITETKVKNIITYEYLYNGGGVAAGDFNNDGLVDLYFTGNQVSNKLYLNKGDFKFEDITEQSGTGGSKPWTNGVTLVDINSDGFLDIYVSNSGWKIEADKCRNELFVNNGDLTFTERAAEYGIDDPSYSTQAIFFDLDRDNDLDLYIVNRPERTYKTKEAYQLKRVKLPGASDRLLRNDNGKFVDISESHGVIQNGLGYGLGVAAGDINKDGWVDLYVTNDYVEPDYLYFNVNGRLAEGGMYAMNHMSNFGMGVDISDINNDNWPDIFVADMAPDDNYRQKTMMKPMNPDQFYWAVTNGFHFQYMFNTLHLNNKNNTLSDVAQLANLATTDWSWTVLFEDLDNDTQKDLMVTNGFRKEFSNKDFIIKADKEMGEAMNSSLQDRVALMESLLKELPETRLRNYLFKNNGDLLFEDVSEEWGFKDKTFSNGAMLVDLNQDGFLDIVVNNIDEEAHIFRNNGNENKSLKISLEGPENNVRGIGTKLSIYQEGQVQYKEHFASRGFHSAINHEIHFGTGNKQVDSLIVTWPDGKEERILNPDESVKVSYTNAAFPAKQFILPKRKAFEPVRKFSKEDIYHRENPHNDYLKEILLPHKMSQFGPAISVGDINGDGMEDFFIGGATGRPGRVFTQDQKGMFNQTSQPDLEKDLQYEDLGAAFFDADNDGDHDLYVTSGGNEWKPGSKIYQDRLYLNNNGTFIKSDNLPEILTSNSIVRPHDIDNDGDLDLFVGSRVHPKYYPTPGESWILENDNGTFKDVSTTYLSNRKLGLITDAKWGDLDGDEVAELVVAGEWTDIKVLKLDDGKLIEKTEEYGLSELTGWWYSIQLEDVNDDGMLDILAGNLGLNYKYKASSEEPFHVFYNDFDQNGTGDIVLGYHDDDGDLYPLRGRQCSSDQMPVLAQKFETYDEFGSANIEEVYGDDNLEESLHLTAKTFASYLLINKGGGQFEPSQLPRMAQISSINSFIVEDFNGDEIKDILYAGNLYPVEIETTRNDASYGGLLLNSMEGELSFLGASETGFLASGDVKHLEKITLSDGSYGILIVRNAGKLELFRYTSNESLTAKL